MKKVQPIIKKALLFTFLLAIVGVLVFAQTPPISTVASAEENPVVYFSEDFYAENGTYTVVTETISYATKSVTAYAINPNIPDYYNMNNSLSNSCANVAGADIIGFYDRYYSNFIPDCEPGVTRPTRYVYYTMANNTDKRQAVINSLYTLMGTNSEAPGTSQAQFKTGLSSYITSKNQTASYYSVLTNGAFDMTKFNTQLTNGRPVALYLSGYNFSDYDDTGSVVTITKNVYQGNHIAVAYGYETVIYYNASGAIVTSKTYILVSTALSGVTGYYILGNNGSLLDAESVQVS